MPNKPNALHVGLVFDDSLDRPDGVAQYVKTLGAWLSGRGHQVSYLVGQTNLKQWSGGNVYSLSKNQKVIFNGNRLSVPLPANRKKLERVLSQNHYDVIHVMMPYSPFMAQKVINSVTDTAIVGTFHIYPSGPLSSVGSRALRLLYGRSLSKFQAIASVSSAAKEFARRAYRIDSETIPNPVDLAKFNIKNAPKAQPGKIVFLGRLVKRKGARQLLEAFAVVSKINPDARLVIAGKGPQAKKLAELSKSLKIDQKVEFVGYVEEENKPKILAHAQIACFPSLNGESFGIVLVEAMAAGAEVVLGGNNPGYASVLGEQPDLLVNPEDKEAFAGRLIELLEDKNLRAELHGWQQKEVKKYDINVVGAQIESMYYEAIARLTKTSDNKHYE